MRSLLFSALALASCRFLSQNAETCNNNDGAFISCDGSSKLVCEGGFQVLVACEDAGVCVDDNTGKGCPEDLFCGDGFKADGEACDDGDALHGNGNSDVQPNACREDCVLPSCGDGVEDNGEECDDGNNNNSDSCINGCKDAKCGDDFVHVGVEDCDFGDTVSFDGCSSTCQAEICGDGIVNNSNTEECDDGNNNSDDLPNACRTDCSEPSCGDGVADTGEICDDGNNDNTDDCLDTCTIAFCGDGFLQSFNPFNEECDDGLANSDTAPNACRTDCSEPICGDGVKDTGEQCDDGNQSNTDACTIDCVNARCGDNLVQAGVEDCDFGDTNNGDGCDSTCQLEICGDNKINNNQTEVCDGTALNGQTCLSINQGFDAGVLACNDLCSGLDTSGCSDCGNGIVEGLEPCDDSTSTTGCKANCSGFDVGTCQGTISLSPPPPPNQGPPPIGQSDTTAGVNNFTGGGVCSFSQAGREQVFSLNPPPNTTFHFKVNLTASDTSRDMSLYYFQGACGGASPVVSCSDIAGGEEELDITVTSGAAPIPIFMVVDSRSASGEGAFTLILTFL